MFTLIILLIINCTGLNSYEDSNFINDTIKFVHEFALNQAEGASKNKELWENITNNGHFKRYIDHIYDIYTEPDNKFDDVQDHETNLPPDCVSALKAYKNAGINLIKVPNSKYKAFYVICIDDNLHTKQNAWTIIHRMEDDKIDFSTRNFSDYSEGFGSLFGSHWLGLEKVYQMTRYKTHELWIKLVSHTNEVFNGRFGAFQIDNMDSGYAIRVLGDMYEGNMRDSFSYHGGMKFSTKDKPNGVSKFCNYVSGGWWYNDCFLSLFTGKYLVGPVPKAKGIQYAWAPNYNFENSFKYVHMAVRPIYTDC